VIATDAYIEGGGTLAELSAEAVAHLNQVLPPHWSHHNPVDILGDGDAERYTRALTVIADDPGNDAILVILTPQAMSQPTETAEQLIACACHTTKPILASWMGGETVGTAMQSLNHAGIPTFGYLDTAAHIFKYLWRYSSNVRAPYETQCCPVPLMRRTPIANEWRRCSPKSVRAIARF
jgi:acetyltransferase